MTNDILDVDGVEGPPLQNGSPPDNPASETPTAVLATVELAEQQIAKVASEHAISPQQVKTLMKIVAKGCNIYEFNSMMYVAKNYWLDAFKKEIWCYKDNKQNLVMFVSRDWFRSISRRDPRFFEVRSCEVCSNDEFEMDIPNATILHKFWKGERGSIIGAYAIATTKDGAKTIEWADIKTYDKWYNTWKSHKAEMIKKVAEVHAMKTAFGITWLQSEEEADSIVEPPRKIEVVVWDEVKEFSVDDLVGKINSAKTITELTELWPILSEAAKVLHISDTTRLVKAYRAQEVLFLKNTPQWAPTSSQPVEWSPGQK